jgi:hypothetical protein
MLGDIVDRGIHSLECYIYLLKWAFTYPERIIWIAGNHDVCFNWSESTREFESSVSPSEFCDFLNRKDAMKGYRQAWGRLFVEFTERLPRAVLFPNGLLATHGGIPHDDHQTKIEELGNVQEQWLYLNSIDCLQDFTWTRIHRNPKKIPNRVSKGCQFGFRNFERFCEVVAGVFPVKHLVNGHEHPSAGYDLQVKYKKNEALTLRGFGFHPIYSGSSGYSNYAEKLYLGQGAESGKPTLLEVPCDLEALRAIYPGEIDAFNKMIYLIHPEQTPPAPPVVEDVVDEVEVASEEAATPKAKVDEVATAETSDAVPEADSKANQPLTEAI